MNTLKFTYRTLVISDDLIAETDNHVIKLFTKASHHHNISIVDIVQNLFKNKKNQTITLNAQCIVLLKAKRTLCKTIIKGADQPL